MAGLSRLNFSSGVIALLTGFLMICVAQFHAVAAEIVFVEASGKQGRVLTLADLDHIQVTGILTRGDTEAISRALALAKEYSLRRYGGPAQPWVFLDSPGGNVSVAMEVGRLLREAAAQTIVFPNRECSSACVFVLAAGVRRTVSPSARVGLHRPRFDPAMFAGLPQVKAIDLYNRMIAQCDGYLSQMGLPRDLLQQMLKIPSQDARFISQREAEMFGLDGEDPGFAEWDRARLLKRYGEEGVRRIDECLNRKLPFEQCP